jgi:hypothetical protein
MQYKGRLTLTLLSPAHIMGTIIERRVFVVWEAPSLELDVFDATHARGEPNNLDSSGGCRSLPGESCRPSLGPIDGGRVIETGFW